MKLSMISRNMRLSLGILLTLLFSSYGAVLYAFVPPCPAVSFVVSGGNYVSNGSSVSFSLNNTASSGNSVMLISVHKSTATTVSTVTYDGVAATLLTSTGVSGNTWLYVYYIINPHTGSKTVSVTTSANDYTIVTAAVYDNAGGVGNYAAANAQYTNTLSTSLTSQYTGDAMVAFAGIRACSNTITLGSPLTTRQAAVISPDRATSLGDIIYVNGNTAYTPNFTNSCASTEVLSIIAVNVLAYNCPTQTATPTMTPTITPTVTQTFTPTPQLMVTLTLNKQYFIPGEQIVAYLSSHVGNYASGVVINDQRVGAPADANWNNVVMAPTPFYQTGGMGYNVAEFNMGSLQNVSPFNITYTANAVAATTGNNYFNFYASMFSDGSYSANNMNYNIYVNTITPSITATITKTTTPTWTATITYTLTPYPMPTIHQTAESIAAGFASTPIVYVTGNPVGTNLDFVYDMVFDTSPSDPLYLYGSVPNQLYLDGFRFHARENDGVSWSVDGKSGTVNASAGIINTGWNRWGFGLMDQAPLPNGLTAGHYLMQMYIAPNLTVTPQAWGPPIVFDVITPSITQTFTRTSTPTFTGTPTFSPTATVTATVTVTATKTVTATVTGTISPTMTASPTITKTITPTVTPTVTGTITLTFTKTATPTGTVTPSLTATSSATPTITGTMTKTVTPTITGTITPTVTLTSTLSVTISTTFSATYTVTQTVTQTSTGTPTGTPTNAGATPYPNPTIQQTVAGANAGWAPTPVVFTTTTLMQNNFDIQYLEFFDSPPVGPLYFFVSLPDGLFNSGLRFNPHAGAWSSNQKSMTMTAATFGSNPAVFGYGLMDQAPGFNLASGNYDIQMWVAPDLTSTPQVFGYPVHISVTGPTATITPTASITRTFTSTPTFSIYCPQPVLTVNVVGANYGCWDGSNFWVSLNDIRLNKISSSGVVLQTYTPTKPILQMAFDGTYLWIGNNDDYGTLQKFNPSTGLVEAEYQLNPSDAGGHDNGGIQSVLWDADIRRLIIGVAQCNGTGDSGLVLKFNPVSAVIEMTITGQTNVNGLAYRNYGGQNYVFAACNDFYSKINIMTGDWSSTDTPGASYRVTSDSQYVYLASYAYNEIVKYNISDGSLVATWSSGTALNAIECAGDYIYTVGNDNTLTVHNKNSGAIVCSLPGVGRSDVVYDGAYSIWAIAGGVTTKLNILGPLMGTLTVSPTITPTNPQTLTPTRTATMTWTVTGTKTASPTITFTGTPTFTITPTPQLYVTVTFDKDSYLPGETMHAVVSSVFHDYASNARLLIQKMTTVNSAGWDNAVFAPTPYETVTTGDTFSQYKVNFGNVQDVSPFNVNITADPVAATTGDNFMDIYFGFYCDNLYYANNVTKRIYVYTATPTVTQTAGPTPVYTPTPDLIENITINKTSFIPGEQILITVNGNVLNHAENAALWVGREYYNQTDASWNSVNIQPTPFATESATPDIGSASVGSEDYWVNLGTLQDTAIPPVNVSAIAAPAGQGGINFYFLNLALYCDNMFDANYVTYQIFVNTVTPSITVTSTQTPTFTATSSYTATKTATPSASQTPTVSFTPSVTSTNTPTSTMTATVTTTVSGTFTSTRTVTATITPTFSFTCTITQTPTKTPTFTITPVRSATFTPTITKTPTITATPTRTYTQTTGPTKTYTLTSTITATVTKTPTLTSTMTATPSITPTFTATQSITPTSTKTATLTVTATVTQTGTNTATQSITLTHTLTATKSATPTFSPTLTNSWTPTVTATGTQTPSITPTFTGTVTSTQTLTGTGTFTQTVVEGTFTVSPTFTPSGTITLTPSPAATLVITFNNANLSYIPGEIIHINIKTNVINTADNMALLMFSNAQLYNGFSSAYWNNIVSTPTPMETVVETGLDKKQYLLGDFSNAPAPDVDIYGTALGSTGYMMGNFFYVKFLLECNGSNDFEYVTYKLYVNTVTPSVTPTSTPTGTITSTSSVTPTFTITGTNTISPTSTNTPSVTVTRTATYTPTYTLTITVSPTRTATQTITRTWTLTATKTISATFTASPTRTVTPSVTPTVTVSPTRTSTPSITQTATITATFTRTATITISPTLTRTPTITATFTTTPTFTATPTKTATKTITGTFTATSTYTATPTVTQTGTITQTSTISPTFTISPTITLTGTATPPGLPQLYILYRPAENIDDKTRIIEPYIQIMNLGSSIDISRLRIRYWFKDELKEQGYQNKDYDTHIMTANLYTGSYQLTPVATVINYNYTGSQPIDNNVKIRVTPVVQGLQDRAFDITFENLGGMGDAVYLDMVHTTMIDVQWKAQVNSPSGKGFYINQGNDWSYSPNYNGPAGSPYTYDNGTPHESNLLMTGLITAYYKTGEDWKLIYGQEPVETGKYSVHVDCGGYGKAADADCGAYSQDRLYAVGGWGCDTFQYDYPMLGYRDYYYEMYYQNQYHYWWSLNHELFTNYNHGHLMKTSYLYNKTFTDKSDNVLYQTTVGNMPGQYGSTNGVTSYTYPGYYDAAMTYPMIVPLEYVFDNVPNGQYGITFRLVVNEGAENDIILARINDQTVVPGIKILEQPGATPGKPYEITVNATVTNGRLEVQYWGFDRLYAPGDYSNWPFSDYGCGAVKGSLAALDVDLIGGFTGMSKKIEPGKSIPPFHKHYFTEPTPVP